MQYAFRGKVAVLVDEMTSSDAEIFAAGVQQLGLGAVVGARTWGGAVGYSSNPELALVDGSGFTIPSFGPYVSGKWMIEQRGVVPDIAVANDPVAAFNGKKRAAGRGGGAPLGLIEKEPKAAAIPAKPEYPDWSFDREVCRAGGDGGAARELPVLARRGAVGARDAIAPFCTSTKYAIRCASSAERISRRGFVSSALRRPARPTRSSAWPSRCQPGARSPSAGGPRWPFRASRCLRTCLGRAWCPPFQRGVARKTKTPSPRPWRPTRPPSRPTRPPPRPTRPPPRPPRR